MVIWGRIVLKFVENEALSYENEVSFRVKQTNIIVKIIYCESR